MYRSKFIKDYENISFVRKYKDYLVLTKKDMLENYKKSFSKDDKRFVFIFENKFGASVIQTNNSYGGKKGLWELAVIKQIKRVRNQKEANSFFYKIIYSTPITNDVLGYLTEKEVEEVLERIKNVHIEIFKNKL